MYINVDIEPSFPGGYSEFVNFIKSTVVYPEMAREMGEQGIVYVRFVVNKNGSIEQVSIEQGVTDALNKEAIRVVSKMPNWIPAKCQNENVSHSMILPIRFDI